MTKFQILKLLAVITHANIHIKGGNFLQDEIYKVIRDSKKHEQVFQEHKVPLKKPKKRRKFHKVDVLVVDPSTVLAINSKGRSFNNTESEDSKLEEYLWYKKALEKEFPGKKVIYIILKDEYDPSNSKLSAYHYYSENGIPVYNTEEFLSQYSIDFEALEQRRQSRCVIECERVLIEQNVDLNSLYEALS